MDYIIKLKDKKKLGFVVFDCSHNRYYKSFNPNDDSVFFTDKFSDCYIFSIRKCAEVLKKVLEDYTNFDFVVLEV